jgi:hypothetical protein
MVSPIAVLEGKVGEISDESADKKSKNRNASNDHTNRINSNSGSMFNRESQSNDLRDIEEE